MSREILVGLSGGLDSLYTCHLLTQQGYRPVGAFLRFHPHSDPAPARALAQCLGIPLHVVDVQERFEQSVLADFVAAYANGRTPNPCAVCNAAAKLPGLAECADGLGIGPIATGHYVQIENTPQRVQLRQAADLSRDQSYFLWNVSQELLGRLVTPMASVIKKQIPQELSQSVGAPESREICFVTQQSYTQWLAQQGLEAVPGDFVDTQGRVLGTHRGVYHYTVGQRKGLEVAAGQRLYVLSIDPKENRVVLGDLEQAQCRGFLARQVNFVSAAPFTGTRTLRVKPRYGSPGITATVTVEPDGFRVEFSQPQRPVAPGQSAVCYDNDTLLFGGVIEKSW